jgi:hypothetical protein
MNISFFVYWLGETNISKYLEMISKLQKPYIFLFELVCMLPHSSFSF